MSEPDNPCRVPQYPGDSYDWSTGKMRSEGRVPDRYYESKDEKVTPAIMVYDGTVSVQKPLVAVDPPRPIDQKPESWRDRGPLL